MSLIRIFGILFSVIIFIFLIYDGQKPISSVEIFLAKKYEQTMDFGTDKYPNSFNNLSKFNFDSYKWILNLIRFSAFIAATFIFVFCVFPYKKVINNLVFTYIFILFVSIFLLIVGLYFQKFTIGFANIQYLKRLIQSPMIALFFGIYYWKINPINEHKIV